ncbi:hypothetical protein SLEP1_g16710 [Rubroshorea leprosula]|uniref:Uncharacterized protein n=1 Tax=Rubroshorea leprosula TaxID=152421 RepID=A0AAV5J0K2_9ROSI|nr:hypothetical protein SLEP1_g16710 [Rubroshorea leprosula]
MDFHCIGIIYVRGRVRIFLKPVDKYTATPVLSAIIDEYAQLQNLHMRYLFVQ